MQSDIVAPLPSTPSATTAEEFYTTAGTELLVLNLTATTNATTGATALSPPRRLDLLPSEPLTNRTIELTNVDNPGAAPVRVACGLRDTFRARTLLLSKHHSSNSSSEPFRRLLIIGTATECVSVHSSLALVEPGIDGKGPSPSTHIQLADALTPSDATTTDVYTNAAFRPFNSTVAVVVDVTVPGAPRLVGAAQYEGVLERAHPEGVSAWLFLRQSTHQPLWKDGAAGKKEKGGVPRALADAEVMPVFRRQVQGSGGVWSWTPFAVIAKCTDVHVLEMEGASASSGGLLAVVPLPLFGLSAGGSQRKDHRLYSGSWDGQVWLMLSQWAGRRVLP
jgi:hypothetical protein